MTKCATKSIHKSVFALYFETINSTKTKGGIKPSTTKIEVLLEESLKDILDRKLCWLILELRCLKVALEIKMWW